MEKIFKAYDILWKIVGFIGCAFVAALAVVTLFQVISRHFFTNPISWTEEFINYGIAWITYIGACICLREGKMLGIEAIKNLFPDRIKTIISFISYFLMFIFLVFMVYMSIVVTMGATGTTTITLGVNMGIVYSVIPIGCILMLLAIIEMAFRDINKIKERRKLEC